MIYNNIMLYLKSTPLGLFFIFYKYSSKRCEIADSGVQDLKKKKINLNLEEKIYILHTTQQDRLIKLQINGWNEITSRTLCYLFYILLSCFYLISKKGIDFRKLLKICLGLVVLLEGVYVGYWTESQWVDSWKAKNR